MNNFIRKNRATVSVIAIAMAASAATVAYAQIVNEVTVTGSSPGGTNDVTGTATESVTVQPAAPAVTVAKSASDTTDVAAGDVVIYTYTITNSGNQTVSNISLADVQEGSGTQPTPVLAASPLTDNGTPGDSIDNGTDAIWDTLAPGDVVTFTASYTVTQSDITTNGVDGDGQLLNTPTATGSSPGNTGNVTDTTDTPFYIDLEDRNPSLLVSKDAGTAADVTAGQTITYTYTVTTNGNVPITNVGLSDNVTAGSGTTPVPALTATPLTDNATLGDSTDNGTDAVWDVLAPGDVVTFTASYVVTQQDVDTLQ
jgi:uncharacterized repeat protein (TIGR01451 family)